jgi:hypothetical protein
MKKRAKSRDEMDVIADLDALRARVRLLYDTSNPKFLERYRQQCAVLAASANAKSEIEWWERLQTDEGWV